MKTLAFCCIGVAFFPEDIQHLFYTGAMAGLVIWFVFKSLKGDV